MFHKRLLKEFKCNQKIVAGLIATQWVSLLFHIVLMLFTADYLMGLLNREVTISMTVRYVAVLGVTLIVRGFMNMAGSKLSFQASRNVKVKLRDAIYKKLLELGPGYKHHIPTSEAVQISTEGVEQLEIYFSGYVPQFFYSLLAPITVFIFVGTMNFKIAITLFLFVWLIPISIIAVQKFAKKMLNKYWGIYTGLGDSFLECLQGLTTLKIYQADQRYADKMDLEAERFRKVTMRVLIMQLNSISIMDLVSYGGAALGIILSIISFRNGTMDMKECFFTIMISAEFFLPLRLLGSFFHISMNGNAAADKIFALLDREKEPDGEEECPKNNIIAFRDVSFRYEQEKSVLQRISFEMEDVGITALVGTSGCGKSTVTSLIMKEMKPEIGEITMGGMNLSDISRTSLHKKITRINHDSYILTGTVKENLRMGDKNATEEAMLRALETVNLKQFVEQNGGLKMQVEERANNLSGGQKQRLALARAILHDSDIYILDEATSNIDAESENYIMKAVGELSKTKPVILISHRLANVVSAKQIYVLNSGKIEERGRHKELIERMGHYYKLWTEQKELENVCEKAGA